MDPEREELQENDVEYVGQLMELSFNSFLGLSSPTTTKLRGIIKNQQIVVMLESGAIHNFISPSVVQRTHSCSKRNMNLEVMLGTGVAVKGLRVCRNVQFGVQDLGFTVDFITLELGSADVILGVQWLRTLGKCQMDWESHEISFWNQRS